MIFWLKEANFSRGRSCVVFIPHFYCCLSVWTASLFAIACTYTCPTSNLPVRFDSVLASLVDIIVNVGSGSQDLQQAGFRLITNVFKYMVSRKPQDSNLIYINRIREWMCYQRGLWNHAVFTDIKGLKKYISHFFKWIECCTKIYVAVWKQFVVPLGTQTNGFRINAWKTIFVEHI